MCGIYCILSRRQANELKNTFILSSFPCKNLKKFLVKRGPNHSKDISAKYCESFELYFFSTTLHLRGDTLTRQPVRNENGSIFVWNGEIFDGFCMNSKSESDTNVLAKKLFEAETTHDILSIISSVDGPYAFIFYQSSGLLWFGRDIFGRRSLLWNISELDFQLSSVSYGDKEWFEVPASGIFCLDLNLTMKQKSFIIHQYLWSSSPSGNDLKKDSFSISKSFSSIIRCVPSIFVQNSISNPLNRTLPTESSCGTLSGLLNEQLTDYQEILRTILFMPEFLKVVLEFENVLSDAVKKRVGNQLNVCKSCYSENASIDSVLCDHSSVGVLFSGGLDSIVIACLVDRHLPQRKPIDLINVAFANKLAIEKHNAGEKYKAFMTPDRITGISGLKELRNVCPNRKWNFVEVNIPDDELACKRIECISILLSPSCTVLDDSIGCALWFASQGKGLLHENDSYCSYTSPVRVLLVGMGADEQLAGYSRHRTKFNSDGWKALVDEVSLELDRISSRNLARDDRIITDNGVESRYPFLDENVVSFLNSLPIWLKANLNFPRGVGEKLLLRLLALKLGLIKAAVLPKRAIQFGSRIAKIENSKEKGSDICERLMKL